jgi:hypothetical protein
MPAGYDIYTYTYTFSSEDFEPVYGGFNGTTAEAALPVGTWDLTVEGKLSEDRPILEGTATGIEVRAGTSVVKVNVPMKWNMEAGARKGVLFYTVSFPDDVIKGTLTVYGWNNEVKQADPLDLVPVPDTGNGGGTITVANGSNNLPAGQYRVALVLYRPTGKLERSDIAHVYPGLVTEAKYTITAADFLTATVKSEQTSLAGVLGSVSGLDSGANVTYMLSAGDETMEAMSVSPTGPVTVTIDGGGRVVTLNDKGSLITVGANVTLVLKNITLKGRGSNYDNYAALVKVNGGTLETRTGVLITANRNASGNGGGVYMDTDGTFTMSGGEITGNTASGGGGVYVNGGTLDMSDGKIAGNTAFGGGGVYVNSGTLDMSGGEIAGNTASGGGGGVWASVSNRGTFAKSGGGTIYGDNDAAHTAGSTENTALSGNGHAVYVTSPGWFIENRMLNETAKPGADLNGGWRDITTHPEPSTVTILSYDNNWHLQSDGSGKRKSPQKGDKSVTKARVTFIAATANKHITIQLEVSSEEGRDLAFISELDNDSATSGSGCYMESRISGEHSITLRIQVPTAGTHFVDIYYEKDDSYSEGSDCAWFKVVIK